jgi:hypothetical protein
MKIFSLQSKRILVGWSIFASLGINFILHFYERAGSPMLASISYKDEKIAGWPIEYITHGGITPHSYRPDLVVLLINCLFWTVVVFIVLILIRYFVNKSDGKTSKTA